MANFAHGRSGHAPGFLRDAFIDWVEMGCDPLSGTKRRNCVG